MLKSTTHIPNRRSELLRPIPSAGAAGQPPFRLHNGRHWQQLLITHIVCHERLITAVVIAAFVTCVAGPASAQPYRVLEVAPLPGTVRPVVTDLNTQLQAVGYSVVSGGNVHVPFIWTPDGTRPLPLSDVVGPLAINDYGVVAGTQRFQTRYQVFALIGSEYRPLPTPIADFVEVVDVTDSGIVHLTTGVCDSWAVYESRLYDLRSVGCIGTIGEDGLLGGARGQRPLLVTVDGRETMPWQSCCGVGKIGAGGHFVGAHPIEPRLFYGTPDRTVSVFPVDVGFGGGAQFIHIGGLNRGGDVVGTVKLPCGSCSLYSQRVFLFRDGRSIDLTTAVPLSRGRLYSAQRITDGGAIAATAGEDHGLLVPTRPVVLVPGVLTPPTGLTVIVDGRLVALLWQPSAGARQYVVQAGSATGLSDLYNIPVGAQTGIAGIVPPGRYFVRVVATDGASAAASAEIVIDVP